MKVIAMRMGVWLGAVLICTMPAGVQDAAADLPKGAAPLPVEIAREYLGEYEMFPGMTIVISLENRQLYATPTGQERAPLYVYAESNMADHFFLTVPKADLRAEILFKRDDDGVVNGLTIIQNFEAAEGTKLPPKPE